MAKDKLFSAKAKSWAKENDLHGAHSFLKFVILNFVDCLAEDSNEFVFKGGNLLWCYIRTPRQTVDLDLATKQLTEHKKVRSFLENAALRGRAKGIEFKLVKYEPIEGSPAASVSIEYRTDEGANNQFEIDIVLRIHAATTNITSKVSPDLEIEVAALENIIVDKVAASQSFGSGNTRVKDFDDLWRIMNSGLSIDKKLLKAIITEREVTLRLDLKWITPEMDQSWQNHVRRYKSLPSSLKALFKEVDMWLQSLVA